MSIKNKFKVLFFSIILTWIVFLTFGCDNASLIIQNDTSDILSVFIAQTRLDDVSEIYAKPVGEVRPGEVLRPKHIFRHWNSYRIEAKDTQGNVVYSKVFTRQELEDMNWEVTINENQ